MSNRTATRILQCILFTYGLLHFLFLWMYTNIDGYFYWAIGRYFQTGQYPFTPPFVYARPTTISPPLYGLLLNAIQVVPHADILLHATHLGMMITSAYLLFLMLLDILSPFAALLVSVMFLLFPANVIFTGSMLTEIPAQTGITVWTFIIYRYLKTKQPGYLFGTLLLSSVLTLLKYQFVLLFAGTLLYLLILLARRKRILPYALVTAGISIGIIAVWIGINYRITGVWGLSDTKKMPFYTNFVWEGRHYPPDTDPSVLALRKYVPASVDRYAEYWDLQDYILPRTNRQWHFVDELLGNVGIAAIRAHPLAYAANGLQVFFKTLVHTAPWWTNVETYGDKYQPQPVYCGSLGTITFCDPVIRTRISFPVWNLYAHLSRLWYNAVMPFFVVGLVLPSLLYACVAKNLLVRLSAYLFLANMAFISYVAMAESRYLIPYYPLIAIVCSFGITSAAATFRRFRKSRTNSPLPAPFPHDHGKDAE